MTVENTLYVQKEAAALHPWLKKNKNIPKRLALFAN